jgi:hypothetical protein
MLKPSSRKAYKILNFLLTILSGSNPNSEGTNYNNNLMSAHCIFIKMLHSTAELNTMILYKNWSKYNDTLQKL